MIGRTPPANGVPIDRKRREPSHMKTERRTGALAPHEDHPRQPRRRLKENGLAPSESSDHPRVADPDLAGLRMKYDQGDPWCSNAGE